MSTMTKTSASGTRLWEVRSSGSDGQAVGRGIAVNSTTAANPDLYVSQPPSGAPPPARSNGIRISRGPAGQRFPPSITNKVDESKALREASSSL